MIRRIALSGCVVLVASCQSDYRKNASGVTDALQKGEYSLAAGSAAAFVPKADTRDKVAVLLEAGRAAQLSGDVEQSIVHYEAADELVRPYLLEKPEALVSEVVTATLVNQTMSMYRATPGERIMLNTLLALNRMAIGDLAGARVELNRAHDWQQAACARYQDEIVKQQAAMTRASAERKTDVSNIRHPKLASLAASVEDRRGYANFANPFSTYIRAVLQLATSRDAGDIANARTDLRAVVGMAPDAAPVIARDLDRIDTRQAVPPTTWIFVLSGLAPHYEELRLDVPIVVGPVPYVAAAFPVFHAGSGGVDGVRASADGSDTSGAMLCDLNEIAGHEYRLRLPGIIVQEVATAATKSAATWAASSAVGSGDSGGSAAAIMMIAGIIYQATSTAADLRCWHSMPQRVHAVALPTPADGVVRLFASDGRELADLHVDSGKHNIVAVSTPSAQAPPSVQVARLDDSFTPSSPTLAPVTPPVSNKVTSTPLRSSSRRRIIPQSSQP